MSLDEQDILRRITELEKVHTRYTGPPGKPGKDAPPPKIMIGTVTSGDQADAKIRTVDGAFVLDLWLPRGSDGRDGISNIPGPVGRAGRDGVDGRVVVGQVIGGHFAAATVRVEDGVQIIDLVLPRGPEGSQGPCGEVGPEGPSGTPGRDGVDGKNSTVPGPAGRDGRDGADGVSNIPGPRGERGEVGPQGIRGERGEVGPQGVPGPQGLRGPTGKPGDISAAVAQAEVEARNVVQEALAEIRARLERLEASRE